MIGFIETTTDRSARRRLLAELHLIIDLFRGSLFRISNDHSVPKGKSEELLRQWRKASMVNALEGVSLGQARLEDGSVLRSSLEAVDHVGGIGFVVNRPKCSEGPRVRAVKA